MYSTTKPNKYQKEMVSYEEVIAVIAKYPERLFNQCWTWVTQNVSEKHLGETVCNMSLPTYLICGDANGNADHDTSNINAQWSLFLDKITSQAFGEAMCMQISDDNDAKGLLAANETLRGFACYGTYWVPGYKGTNFLHLAASRASQFVLEAALNKAPPEYINKALLVQDAYGRTPLHWAAMSQNMANLEIIFNKVDIEILAEACVLRDKPSGLLNLRPGGSVFDYLSSNLTKQETKKQGFQVILKKCLNSMQLIKRDLVAEIAKQTESKDALFELIKNETDVCKKLALINVALDKNTSLGQIMWYQRGLFFPDIKSDTLDKLVQLRDYVNNSVIGNCELQKIKHSE